MALSVLCHFRAIAFILKFFLMRSVSQRFFNIDIPLDIIKKITLVTSLGSHQKSLFQVGKMSFSTGEQSSNSHLKTHILSLAANCCFPFAVTGHFKKMCPIKYPTQNNLVILSSKNGFP